MSPADPAGPLSGQLTGPLAVVAHDAGGAEILSSLLRRGVLGPQPDVRLVLAGPALAIFERKLGSCRVLPLAQALDGAGTLLSGTGWMGDLEWQALAAARAAGVRSIAFLDHWVNYPERFMRRGRQCLPDALWVGDEPALALARQQLPQVPATLVPNPYFDDARESLVALMAAQPTQSSAPRVLYLCEPVREPALRQFGNPRHHGYTEEEALAYALSRLPAVLGPIDRFVCRPHPSEAPDKYDRQLFASGLKVLRGGALPLFAEVAAADVVLGLNSVAMVVALLGGKRVFSAMPPGAAPCILPLPGIRMLRDALPALASPA
jgi:hypothetical protein